MAILLSEEQLLIRNLMRRFSDQEIEPHATEMDRTCYIPEALTRKLAELDFFGLYVPEDYGGTGQSLTNACLALVEIARASPGYAGMLNVQMVICPAAIAVAGTSEQKQQFLPALAKGKSLLAFSVSEPAGARNRIGHETTISTDGSDYRISGGKIFCTLGDARHMIALGRTERDGQTGYGWAIVDRQSEGVTVSPEQPMLGWHGMNVCTYALDNVHIPADRLLGDRLGANLSEANWASNIGHAATSLGAAQGMLEKTIAYVKERSLYGRPMDRLQPVSYRLAMAYSTIQACEALLYDTTRQWDAGWRNRAIASVCKAWISDRAFETIHDLLQLWGGSGMMDTTGVNRYFRDSRASMVAEGPSDLHYDYVAAYLLDRPADAQGGG